MLTVPEDPATNISRTCPILITSRICNHSQCRPRRSHPLAHTRIRKNTPLICTTCRILRRIILLRPFTVRRGYHRHSRHYPNNCPCPRSCLIHHRPAMTLCVCPSLRLNRSPKSLINRKRAHQNPRSLNPSRPPHHRPLHLLNTQNLRLQNLYSRIQTDHRHRKALRRRRRGSPRAALRSRTSSSGRASRETRRVLRA